MMATPPACQSARRRNANRTGRCDFAPYVGDPPMVLSRAMADSKRKQEQKQGQGASKAREGRGATADPAGDRTARAAARREGAVVATDGPSRAVDPSADERAPVANTVPVADRIARSDHDVTDVPVAATDLGGPDDPAVTAADGHDTPTAGILSDLASVARYVLAVSYPVLALSTGVRALYRLLLKDGVVWQTGAGLSLLASLLYLGATIGFAVRRPWAWWTSVALLSVETALTLVVGTISVLEPGLIGSTVWRHFGADYGYFPLFQPLLGLVWLLWPVTVADYGVRAPWLPRRWYGG